MKVREVMTQRPATCSPTDTCAQAATLMKQHDCGSAPVVEGGKLVGIVTDRDIAIRVVAQGKDPQQTQVGEIATDQPYYVHPDQDLDEALELMAYRKVRRLPVVDDGQLVGMLAQADVVHEAKEKKAAQVIEEISQP